MTGAVPPLPVTTIVNCFELFPAAFVALTVKLDVPAVVGVPEINPVFWFRVKPDGKLPLDIAQVIGGVPVATKYRL